MILQKLYELAKHVKPVGNARVVAAVVQKGRIICIASNEKKTDPSQKKANKHLCRCGHGEFSHGLETPCRGYNCKCLEYSPIEEEKIHWHAETKVIKRAKKLVKGTHPGYLDGCVLYVARAKKVRQKGWRTFNEVGKIVDVMIDTWVQGLAKPCPGCWQAIHDSGITKVKFTEDV